MNTVTAQLNTLRQAPRKVRLIADLIRGKTFAMARKTLSFAPKRSSQPLQKLLDSAAANAKNRNISIENLVVQTITVDKGTTLYRRRPMSRGRPFPIKKRTSHISLVLGEKVDPKSKATEAKSSKP